MKETMIQIDFPHRQSAHCESGVLANLLCHKGVALSEAMAFGIGAGLYFGYLPFLRLNGLPLTTYRCEVGGIFKRATKRLGCRVYWEKFRDPHKAMAALDEKMAAGIAVACRTGGYWLPYFPPAFRFHFNMHNLVVVGKENGDYLISDPVFPVVERCPEADLVKARFSEGALAPKGTMYYLESVPAKPDLKDAVIRGIRDVCRRMLYTPGPMIGVSGIGYLAKQIEGWPAKLGAEKAILYVGQLIRMQEEIGTGGGGFRFMYAAFLQEAAELLERSALEPLSVEMTAVGDLWRKAAVIGARICKGRAKADQTYGAMSETLQEIGSREKQIYKTLLEAVKT
ncbi:MAG: BtrH N-terminal domain-containing protein [Desulfosarcinaceae bacterium]|jgi:hypothetical protein